MPSLIVILLWFLKEAISALKSKKEITNYEEGKRDLLFYFFCVSASTASVGVSIEVLRASILSPTSSAYGKNQSLKHPYYLTHFVSIEMRESRCR